MKSVSSQYHSQTLDDIKKDYTRFQAFSIQFLSKFDIW